MSIAAVFPAAADQRTTADAVYTKAQAKKGEKLFKQNCLVCHDKKYFRPVLKVWNGQSVGIFYDMMAGSMPEKVALLKARMFELDGEITKNARARGQFTP